MAAKIKDGLFIGDAETSQSEVFINDNKISNLINLAGREVPNIWSSHGLVYLTYNWEDRPDYRLFSGQDDTILTDIVEFVDVSIAHGISVLLFSKRGTGRCVIAACLYLMMKYRWGFEKSYDYVYSKKPDIDLNKGFIQQMFALDMKLLAARQKAYALKHGIENGFRIEPNMTINDIAAMLPPTEAKRWNSWDPNYILAPNNVSVNSDDSRMIGQEDSITWQKYADAIVNALRKKDSLHTKSMTNKQKVTFRVMDDAEEELVLIFSFMNSKNTITALPGPYHNAYEIQKNFKLRFDNVVFEEDINMFPTSPVNLRYGYLPRGILKGGKQRQASHNNNNNSNNNSQYHQTQPQQSNHSSQSQTQSNPTYRLHEYLPPSEDKTSATVTRTSLDYSDGPSSRANTSSTVSNSAEELYRYVGLAPSEPKTTTDPSIAKTREEKKAFADLPSTATTTTTTTTTPWTIEDDQKAGLSAEERLRKLMADMQRSNHFPDHLKGDHNNNSRPLAPPHQSKSEPFDDHYYSSNNTTISLHDLANMPVQTATSSATTTTANLMMDAKLEASSSYRRSYDNNPLTTATSNNNGQSYHHRPTSSNSGGGRGGNNDLAMTDFEDDGSLKPSSADPLAAFDMSFSKSGPGGGGGGGQKGPLKARHDIPTTTRTTGMTGSNPTMTTNTNTNSTTRTSMTKQAWNATTTPTNNTSNTSNSSNNNRPPSPPTTRPASPNAGRGVSSNASVGSVGSAGGGSNNASNNNFVGTGSTSSARVYRHGSPAPNTRPAFGRSPPNNPSPRQPTSTNNSNFSVNSNSVSSLGSGMSNLPPGNGNGTNSNNHLRSSYSAPANNRPSSASNQRYSSPFAANPSNNNNNPSVGTPQRRGSFSSVNSVGSQGSNNPPPSSSSAAAAAEAARRKAFGTSPLRASYSGGGGGNGSGMNSNSSTGSNLSASMRPSSATSISSKRFSTPTPQSEQHNSNNNLSSSRAVRSSTPTKNTWKF